MSSSESLIREIETHYILHWNFKNLRFLPPELLHERGHHLEELYLKDNRIAAIPADLGQFLPNLANLYLPGNELREFPACLRGLRCLRVLDLRHNHIAVLAGEAVRGCGGEVLVHLVDLDLSDNLLDELPDCVGEIKSNYL